MMRGGARVGIRAGAGEYAVHVGPGLLAEAATRIADTMGAAAYAIISDERVDGLYGDRLAAALREVGRVERIVVAEGEASKRRDVWALASDRMLDAGLGRDCAVVALGGGVPGDLAGFVAATYLRGVPVIQLPTSLLAMVDSSVGGKTGVNTHHGKNLIGAFHPPALVLADPEVLATLDPRQMRSGLAECVKHACIADAEHFDWIERRVQPILAHDPEVLAGLIERSVRIKAAVVEADEREGGIRKILNFGHTLGHAEEHATGYRRLHGEAVAVGMVAEARLGEALGVTRRGTARRIADLLGEIGLPIAPEGDADAVVRATASDKKVRAGRVEYVLLEEIGRVARRGEAWTFPVEDDAVLEVVGEG